MKDHNLILRSSQGNQTNTPVFQKRLTQKRSNYPDKLSTEVGMLSEPPLYIACQGYLLLRYPSRLENRQTCGRAPSCFHRRNIWASKRNRVNQRYGRNITGTLNLFLRVHSDMGCVMGSFQFVTVFGYVLEAYPIFL